MEEYTEEELFARRSEQCSIDVEDMSPQALRDAYKGEATSHRNMKQRVAKGQFSLDPAWREFRAFLRDMGPKPTAAHTLDRIDPSNQRYGPGLCRWADKSQQTVNRRNTIWVEWDGQRITLAEFARRVGLPYQQAHYQHSRGRTLEEIAGDCAGQTGRYCPLRYQDDPDGLRDWYRKFAAWKRTIKRSSARYARPEVFDILKVSEFYSHALSWLDANGWAELTPEDGERVQDLLNTPWGRISSSAPEWINHAIASLARDDPKLANGFLPRIGNRMADLFKIEQHLTRETPNPS